MLVGPAVASRTITSADALAAAWNASTTRPTTTTARLRPLVLRPAGSIDDVVAAALGPAMSSSGSDGDNWYWKEKCRGTSSTSSVHPTDASVNSVDRAEPPRAGNTTMNPPMGGALTVRTTSEKTDGDGDEEDEAAVRRGWAVSRNVRVLPGALAKTHGDTASGND